VYMARKRESGECVAIKIMRPEIAGEGRKVERFLQESRIAAKLLHPNIARVLDCESTGRSALIAMEFVHGRTLAQIVHQRGPLPADEARAYAKQAALGLACAADHGVVHRDIKPQNLMFDPRLRLVKIVDFGLGRLVDEQRSGSRLTRPEEILGTLDYISPEQAANSRDADVRSDIYSLGCTLYYLLAGAPPFVGKNAVDLLRKHESETPAPIRSLRGDIPQDFSNLIDWALQKDPKQRPQSPHQILDHLERCTKAGSSSRWAGDGSLLNANDRPSNLLAKFGWLRSPIVWLPLLTFFACIMWLLFR
jgi:serine/threonine protein kinase